MPLNITSFKQKNRLSNQILSLVIVKENETRSRSSVEVSHYNLSSHSGFFSLNCITIPINGDLLYFKHNAATVRHPELDRGCGSILRQLYWRRQIPVLIYVQQPIFNYSHKKLYARLIQEKLNIKMQFHLLAMSLL